MNAKPTFLLFLSFLILPSFAFSQQIEKEEDPSERETWQKSLISDPKTGLVPRDELEKSRSIMFKRIEQNKNLRTDAAIPNVKWVERGPNNVGGRTRALLFDPNDPLHKKVWVGGVAGGLWYNNDITDANVTWQKVNDLWDNISIGWIADDPSNPKIMYVGTGERGGSASTDNTGGSGSGGSGIWKTTDAGTTWTRLASTTPNYTGLTTAAGWREIYKIIVNAQGHIYVLNFNGIYKSTDGGTTWQGIGTGTNAPSNDFFEQISDMEMGTDGILYVAEGSAQSAAKLYKSTDATASAFTIITPSGTFKNGRVEIALAPSTKGASQMIYAVSALSGTAKANFFLKSLDAGATWLPMNVPVYEDLNGGGEKPFMGDQGSYDLILGTHATNPNILYAAGIGYSVSTDAGETWLPKMGYSELQTLMHVDNHAFLARPGFPDEAIFGNDGGVYYAPNWATSGKVYPKLQKRNKGYNVTQFFSVDINSVAGNSSVVAGTQDNGTQSINSAYGTVGAGAEINGGDGGLTFIDKLDSNIVITSYTHVTPKLNKEGTFRIASGTEMTPQFDKRGQFINPADYDSPNHTLYHNNTLTTEKETKIVRYHIAGASPNYTYTLSNITIQGIGALTISFLKLGKTAGTLYLGTSDGDVYKVTGINPAGDQVVTNINKLGDSQAREDQTLATTKIMDKATTSTGNVSSIDFGTDENTLIVTKSNYNIKSVFYTTDAGTAWVSKDDSLHGLPNIPIRYALINPKSPKQVLLATELGVWSTIDITATNPKWEPNNTTLANVRCDMLKYRASDETVVVATHGRGVFSTKINQPDCITPVADNQTICDATTASLTANCATGTTATWYDAAGTTKAGSGSPFITPSLTAKTSYKVRCETPDCKSAFVDVTITVNPAIEAPIAHETIIKPDVEMPLKATCTTGTPVWYETATSVTPLGTGSFTTPKLEKSVSYYVACESGGKPNCASSRTHQFVKMHLFGAESVELPGNISSVEKGSIQNQAAFRVKSELGDAEIAVDVYPNPTTGLCYWILESKDATDVNLSLFNTQGQEELNQTLPTPSQIHEGTIDLRKLETGSYFLKFKVGDKSVVRKIIKN